MTIKQVLIGTLVGVGALGFMLHRLPKTFRTGAHPEIKPGTRTASRANHRSTRKNAPEARSSTIHLLG